MYPAKELQEQIAKLSAHLGNLDERDQTFASSLLGKANLGYMLTEKQRHWVGVLADRASGAQTTQTTQTTQVGVSFAPIHALLHRAAEKLKKPIVRIAVEVPHPSEPGRTGIVKVRLTIAGPRSKYAGSINITAGTAPGEGGQRDWYGSINAEGRLFLSGKFAAFQAPLRAALERVAADPANAAKLFGQITSACCFCGLELTDGASIAVGYGPICAEKWGLSHGHDHGIKGGHRQQDIRLAK